jgi:hypothetical protein
MGVILGPKSEPITFAKMSPFSTVWVASTDLIAKASIITVGIFTHFTETHSTSFEGTMIFTSKNMIGKAFGLDFNLTDFLEDIGGCHVPDVLV